jgi:hypothetical protein
MAHQQDTQQVVQAAVFPLSSFDLLAQSSEHMSRRLEETFFEFSLELGFLDLGAEGRLEARVDLSYIVENLRAELVQMLEPQL